MDHRSKGPPLSGSIGGSSRAKQMLAMATGGKAGRGLGSSGKPPAPQVVYSRKPKQLQAPKREAEGGSLFDGLHATPKKQRTPSTDEPEAAPTSVPPVPSPSALLGLSSRQPLAPAAPRPSRGAATCTQLRDCYQDRQWLRERQQEREEQALRQRLSSGSGASFRRGFGARTSLGALPAGMLNLGNTCYLNAVLQVLLSLPSFVGDLQRGRRQLEAAGQPLSSGGVFAALLECVAARDARMDRHIKPSSLKRALDASSAAFRGTLQQDAHELFVSLLEGVQREVLAREVARLGRSRVRASETVDPGARSFGFAMQHELTCSRCGRTSSLVEEYMHLSLELPAPQPGSGAACSVADLLRNYFEDEEVEKSCEGCGEPNLPHVLRHHVRRPPRVLVLHLKRFQVSWSPEQQQAMCRKLHTQVSIAERVQLGPFLAVGAAPQLPGGEQWEAGKENEQLGANVGAARDAVPAAAEEWPAGKGRGPLPRRSGAAFYGGGGAGYGRGAATPVASSALLSPATLGSPLLRRRQATPATADKAKGLRDDEDAALQQALAASLLERQELLPAGQRELSPPAGVFDLNPQRRAVEEKECPLAGADAVPVLPPEVAAAAAAGSTAGTCSRAGGGGRLENEWWMGLGRPSDSARLQTAAEREEEQLQHALEMSRLEHEHRQQHHERHQHHQRQASAGTCAGPVGSTVGKADGGNTATLGLAAAAQAKEEADLQEAIKLSMMDAWPAQPATAEAASGGQAVGRGAGQLPEEPACQSILDILGEVMPGQLSGTAAGTTGSAAAGHAQPPLLQQDGATAAAEHGAAAGEDCEQTEPVEVGGVAAGTGMEAPGGAGAGTRRPALRPPAPAYLQAQIVEDDDPLLAEAEAAGAVADVALGRPAGACSPAAGPGTAAGAGAVAGPAAAGMGAKPPAARYRLHAVVNHKGPAASCGHFTSDIRDPASSVWHRFDDSLASRISQAEACSSEKQRECYLLFYAI